MTSNMIYLKDIIIYIILLLTYLQRVRGFPPLFRAQKRTGKGQRATSELGGSPLQGDGVGMPSDGDGDDFHGDWWLHSGHVLQFAIENGPFIVDLPVKDYDFLWLC